MNMKEIIEQRSPKEVYDFLCSVSSVSDPVALEYIEALGKLRYPEYLYTLEKEIVDLEYGKKNNSRFKYNSLYKNNGFYSYRKLLEADKDTSSKVLLYGNPFNPFYSHISYLENHSVEEIKQILKNNYKDGDLFDKSELLNAVHKYEQQVLRQQKEECADVCQNLFYNNLVEKLDLLSEYQYELKIPLEEGADTYLGHKLDEFEKNAILHIIPDKSIDDYFSQEFYRNIENYILLSDFVSNLKGYPPDRIGEEKIKRLVR